MTKTQLIDLLLDSVPVYWSNRGYVVFLQHGKLYTRFSVNGWTIGLDDNEIVDCFVG
jgi:hypothetical protein